MDIKLLVKLCELKKQEIDALRNDYKTLENIVAELDNRFNSHQNSINEFVVDYANNENCSDNSISILNGRVYLQSLNSKRNELEKNLTEAVIQKDAAFESLKETAIELLKLTKVIEKEHKLEIDAINNRELLISDTLEIYRYSHKGA